VEELEALRLAHVTGLYQQEAAEWMAVSRQTFGRLLEAAHRKVTQALVEGQALRIEGGTFHMSPPQAEQTTSCHPTFEGVAMNIAIPTMDEQTLSAHFGRSKAFLVFEVENGQILSRQVRPNIHGHQAHGHLEHHEHGHAGQGHGHHDHGGFIALLHDCSVVLSRGMGAGAWNALRGAGMKVYLVQQPVSAEEAVGLFLAGQLTESAEGVCRSHAHS
jgi:predicted Fe-Mo cluster-binding NifX family protein